MRREAKKLLWDMREAGEAVAEFLTGKTLEDYRRDRLLRSGVEREPFIVGEALSQLSRWDDALAQSFTERPQIVGFRNRLAHGYSGLVDERVYEVAVHDLPGLMSRVGELLAE